MQTSFFLDEIVNNRWASFFSVGAMWNMTKEGFLYDVDWLSDLRLKASYGTTGNSAFEGDPYYPALGLVGTGNYNGGQYFAISSVQNDDLTWEKQKTLNIGFNSRFFNRLSVDFDFYNKVTEDMLMTVVLLPRRVMVSVEVISAVCSAVWPVLHFL